MLREERYEKVKEAIANSHVKIFRNNQHRLERNLERKSDLQQQLENYHRAIILKYDNKISAHDLFRQ